MEDRIDHLLLRFEEGDMSEIEREELLTLIDHAEQKVGQAICSRLEQQIPLENMEIDRWNAVLDNVVSTDRIVLKGRTLWSFVSWTAAAVVLITLSFASYFYLQPLADQQLGKSKYTENIRPGRNEAVLTLADGSEISLTDAGKGEVVKANGISIVKAADGKLVYNIDPTTINANVKIDYNTITTPRGGAYQINLPDGTRVWLNAASSLRFPQSFLNSEERIVELNGEAYFEVAKNKKQPFKVITPDFGRGRSQETLVLGTHFNISAYADDAETKTTLLEGSIQVKDQKAAHKVVLVPGQQAVLSNNQLNAQIIDTEEAIAWKKGDFMFVNSDIESIMRKISRWYNVDIVYQGQISTNNYIGTVSRFSNVSEVLSILELTKTVHFKIEGRRITVMP